MYVIVVALTMLILPIASIAIEHFVHPELALLLLVGRWFVFWGIGARLGLAGIRQLFQPAFTAQQIFDIDHPGALVLVRELGLANIASALVAILSLWKPGFVLPAAIAGAIFYAGAGALHVAARERSRNENIAMTSDLFMAIVLLLFAAASFAG